MLEQGEDDVEVAAADGGVERRVAVALDGLDVGPLLDEQVDAPDVARERRCFGLECGEARSRGGGCGRGIRE